MIWTRELVATPSMGGTLKPIGFAVGSDGVFQALVIEKTGVWHTGSSLLNYWLGTIGSTFTADYIDDTNGGWMPYDYYPPLADVIGDLEIVSGKLGWGITSKYYNPYGTPDTLYGFFYSAGRYTQLGHTLAGGPSSLKVYPLPDESSSWAAWVQAGELGYQDWIDGSRVTTSPGACDIVCGLNVSGNTAVIAGTSAANGLCLWTGNNGSGFTLANHLPTGFDAAKAALALAPDGGWGFAYGLSGSTRYGLYTGSSWTDAEANTLAMIAQPVLAMESAVKPHLVALYDDGIADRMYYSNKLSGSWASERIFADALDGLVHWPYFLRIYQGAPCLLYLDETDGNVYMVHGPFGWPRRWWT